MYKLTVISGPNRGSSYKIGEGEHSIGRTPENVIVLKSGKVSRTHCVLKVVDQKVFLEDQESANGTFVNGVLIRSKPLKSGDQISVGEFVLELHETKRRLAGDAPPAVLDLVPHSASSNVVPISRANLDAYGNPIGGHENFHSDSSSSAPPSQPTTPWEWAQFYFERYVMAPLYVLHQRYQWRSMAIATFSAFLFLGVVLMTYPLLQFNRQSVFKEVEQRAAFMARNIIDTNEEFIAASAESKTSVASVEKEFGVELALLVDLDSRIIAPGRSMNQTLAAGQEAVFAKKAAKMFRDGRESGFSGPIGSNRVIAIEPLKVYSTQAARNVVMAMAVVSIDAGLSMPDMGSLGVIYAKGFILLGMLGLIWLMVGYRLTLNPLENLNKEMDQVLKGDLAQISKPYRWEELDQVFDVINSALQRIPLDSGAGGLGNQESQQGVTIEDIVQMFQSVGSATGFGLYICDSQKRILYMNPKFEDLSGIRFAEVMGQTIETAARDQAFVALNEDLFQQVEGGLGGNVQERFDFGGVTYKVQCSMIGTKQGFLITIVPPEDFGA